MRLLHSRILEHYLCSVKARRGTCSMSMRVISRFTCTTSSLLEVRGQNRWLRPGDGVRRWFSPRFCSSLDSYTEAFRKAAEEPERFWSEAAHSITWLQKWNKTLDCTDEVFPRW
ncbi:acyl-CoA synthetase short-chain family member 3, mitochondrial [Silurus meridionalis]|nr:acyl-CoA synthetase short-chain family member 3, mitochondrial [Silurus meridionalis]